MSASELSDASYKARRKTYAREKKRAEQELLSTLLDESIVVLADWLKVRGSLKSWTRLWCVLKPGMLIIYRNQKTKSSNWVGTVLLTTCRLIERPSKKDGFCFKLFHPLDQSVWASKGPQGETMGAVTQPLPTSHLILRAPNNAAGKCWLDALEVSLKCTPLTTLRSRDGGQGEQEAGTLQQQDGQQLTDSVDQGNSVTAGNNEASTNSSRDTNEPLWSESEIEQHFNSDVDESAFLDASSLLDASTTTADTMQSDDFSDEYEDYIHDNNDTTNLEETEFKETEYVANDPSLEVFGSSREQTEEISDENKSIVWFLIKQVRPGMDLSRVVLPTFILEPRSFLEKLSDYHYHDDLIEDVIREESAMKRMELVVKWFLSGFYKKPKGLKKPYNPIIGEAFRCYFYHPNSKSKTFFIAEQVSHHPPISAFYASNRAVGFTISSSIVAKSKFYGNATSAILEGNARLLLLNRGEEYTLSFPYAHCKGIIMGTLTMELGGDVIIACTKTGYSAELKFKLRPFMGGGELSNAVTGHIKLGNETLSTLTGKWDEKITFKEKKANSSEGTSKQERVLWEVNEEIKSRRLVRYTVPIEEQEDNESAKLWNRVSEAIAAEDQEKATEEKTRLEDIQRTEAKSRNQQGVQWVPRHFEFNPMHDRYEYRHADHRPWDPLNDVRQYEHNFIIGTVTRHATPLIRTESTISVIMAATADNSNNSGGAKKQQRSKRRRRSNATKTMERMAIIRNSSSELDCNVGQSISNNQETEESKSIRKVEINAREAEDELKRLLTATLEPLSNEIESMHIDLLSVRSRVESMQNHLDTAKSNHGPGNYRELVVVVTLLAVVHLIVSWMWSNP